MKYLKYIQYAILVSMLFLFISCEDCGIREIGTDPLPDGVVGLTYDTHINLETECRPLLEEFYLVGGVLPPGLSLYRDGRIHGTPTRKGDYFFTVIGEVCYSEDVFGYFDCYERSRGLSINVD